MSIGKNQLCPCGSRRKYKWCHGASPRLPNSEPAKTLARLVGEAAGDKNADIIVPPTPEVRRACSLLDEAKRRFLAADRFAAFETVYEADGEAHLQILLCVRHLEAVTLLAQDDLVTLPSALIGARGLLETGVRALWLLEPDDPFERERRWMVTLRERIRALQNLVNDCEQAGFDASAFRADLAGTTKFADEVELAIEKRVPKYVPLRGTASTLYLLESFGRRDLYVRYRASSQFTHGTQLATEWCCPAPADRFGTEVRRLC